MNATTACALRRLAISVGGGLAVALLSLAMESGLMPGQMLLQSQDSLGGTSAPAHADRAAELVTLNACWTGAAPLDMVGELPGRVVVTVDGTTRVGGSRMVGLALQQLFEGQDHSLTVHGFCR